MEEEKSGRGPRFADGVTKFAILRYVYDHEDGAPHYKIKNKVQDAASRQKETEISKSNLAKMLNSLTDSKGDGMPLLRKGESLPATYHRLPESLRTLRRFMRFAEKNRLQDKLWLLSFYRHALIKNSHRLLKDLFGEDVPRMELFDAPADVLIDILKSSPLAHKLFILSPKKLKAMDELVSVNELPDVGRTPEQVETSKFWRTDIDNFEDDYPKIAEAVEKLIPLVCICRYVELFSRIYDGNHSPREMKNLGNEQWEWAQKAGVGVMLERV